MGLSFRLSVIHRKRMKGRRFYQQEMEIPNDVVMEEILTRLPAKSLMRFKCVSKLWSSLISSRYFSNRFLTVPTRPRRPRIYMCLQDNTDYRNSVTLSLAEDTTTSASCCFVVDHNLTHQRVGGHILQNLCGFMCYSFMAKPRIYNPATRQLVTLPAPIKSQTEDDAYGYYFGYDPVIDQYNVVWSTGDYVKHLGVMRSEHKVFVLKAGGEGSWKKASPDFLPHIPAKRGVCIDGVIYYMGWTSRYNVALVSFHIRSGDFKMIQVPRRDGDEVLQRITNVSLIEYGGKVTIIDQTNLREKGMLDLWAVEDARWSRKTMLLQSSQLHLVINNKTIYNMKGTTHNNKVFFVPEHMFSPFHILSYDLGSNDMTKIEIKGIPDHWFRTDKESVYVMLMDQSESLVRVLGDLN